MASWKRIAIRAAAGGAGLGLVLAISAAVALFYANRPKGWNDRALRVVHAEGHPLARWNREFKEESSGVTFAVDIQNTTGSDITIPKDLKVLSQTKETHALKMTFLQLGREYFLPAGHTVSVSLDASDLCAANYDPRQCYESYFKEADALVIFDDRNRYKINIPMPPLIYQPDTKRITE